MILVFLLLVMIKTTLKYQFKNIYLRIKGEIIERHFIEIIILLVSGCAEIMQVPSK